MYLIGRCLFDRLDKRKDTKSYCPGFEISFVSFGTVLRWPRDQERHFWYVCGKTDSILRSTWTLQPKK